MSDSTDLHTCPTCFKCFKRRGDLTRHMSLHTGVKRYKCEQCDKAFSQSSGLKTHNNIHSKARPFKCGLAGCESAFGDPSSCHRHRNETHGHARPYKCPHTTCKSRIKRRSAFVAHLKTHGIDPSTVNIDMMTPKPSSLQWKRHEMVSAETDSSSAVSWLYQPSTDPTSTSAPQYLYGRDFQVVTQAVGNGNNWHLLPGKPYDSSRSSSESLSSSPLTFSLSPSPTPSSFSELNRNHVAATENLNMSGHIIPSLASSRPSLQMPVCPTLKDFPGWYLESMFS